MALQRRGVKRPSQPVKKELPHRINDMVRGKEVRLVGDNVQPNVYPLQQAREMARNLGLDLVELNQIDGVPLCRIMNYSKFMYEKKRKEKEIKAKSKSIEVKEIRFTAETDEHDFNFKAKHAEAFLKDGNKVRACVLFRGRAIHFQERGQLLLLKFAEHLSDFGQLENMPKMEGKKMFALISPKRSQKSQPRHG